MHSLLMRQLKKFCRDGVVTDLPGLTAAVEAAYQSFEDDRAHIERTLDVMSRELGERNRQLAAQLVEKQSMMDAISHTNDVLVELNQKLAVTQNQLLQADKMASIGQLAAGVAHEINNPLAFVHSNVGVLENYLKEIFELNDAYFQASKNLPAALDAQLVAFRKQLGYDDIVADVADLMAESKDGLARVKKIVQDLKDFSRIDTSGWDQVDVTAGLKSTLALVRHQVHDNVAIVCEYAPLPAIDCVPSQLNQVFMNILINAAQAIGESGTMTIRTGSDAESVWVAISDTGNGIPPENIARIFDAFFTTKPVGVGTGLGLSLSYSIVKRHHGHIDIQSQVGCGSTFTVVLPLRQPHSEEADLASTTSNSGAARAVE